MLAAPDLDLVYMREALRLAEAAASRGDVPVGAIVVQDGRVTGTGFNTREAAAVPPGHAGIGADAQEGEEEEPEGEGAQL